MEIRYLLPKEGQFYKANLHSHTTVSDGKWTPEQAKEIHQAHGYSILAYTDHRRYRNYPQLTDETFLALAGLETDLNQKGDNWNRLSVYHFCLIDTDPTKDPETKSAPELGEQQAHLNLFDVDYDDIDAINAYIKRISDLGFLVTYNHPWWSLQTYADYTPLKGLFAMEIYNHGCEHDALFGAAPQAYDDMLRAGQRLYCLSTDDNHNHSPLDSPRNDSFGGYTMIKAEKLDYPTVIAAMKAGHFYSSTGPELHALYIEGDQLVIQCDPVEKIFVTTEGRHAFSEFAPAGETITQATFTLKGDEGFIRVDCRDAKGFHAYSNAYYL